MQQFRYLIRGIAIGLLVTCRSAAMLNDLIHILPKKANLSNSFSHGLRVVRLATTLGFQSTAIEQIDKTTYKIVLKRYNQDNGEVTQSDHIIEDVLEDNITLLLQGHDILYRTTYGAVVSKNVASERVQYSFFLPRSPGERKESLVHAVRSTGRRHNIFVIDRDATVRTWIHQEMKELVARERINFIHNQLRRETGLNIYDYESHVRILPRPDR